MNYQKHVLKNGLRVVLVSMKDTQTVTVQILVEAGSKYENKKNNGISHFLEHMMFKGTKKRPSSRIITEELDSIGGEYNAFTSKEETGYWVKVTKQHFDLALDVVSDLYLNSLLEQKEIDKERGVILQEAAMYRDTPMRYVWDVFEGLLYKDQPAGWDIIGTKENIRNLNREDFVEYLQKMYLPESTVVVISGNFDEKIALKKVQEYFGKKETQKASNDRKKTIDSQESPQLKIHFKKTDQTHLILGVRSCDMFSQDRYVTALLGTILGGGMSSRMFLNIREKHALTYYIDAGAEQTLDTGYFFVRAGVQHEKLKKTIGLILEELKKVKNIEVSVKELKKAKEYIKGKTLMSLESSTAMASFFGEQELFRKKLRLPEEIFKKIESITAKEISLVARKIFQNESLNLALVGPHKNNQELKVILNF